MAIKPFHELTLADDFMFGEVMRRPENAKPFLEALLGKKKGECVDVTVPAGTIKFEILDINI